MYTPVYVNKYIYIIAFLGYTNNFHRSGDEILVLHSHELPSVRAAPYPCELISFTITDDN